MSHDARPGSGPSTGAGDNRAQVRVSQTKWGPSSPFLRRMLERLGQPLGPLASAPARRARQLVASCCTLLTELGEVSGPRLAAEALAAYQALDPDAREAFFDLLVEDFSPDPIEVARAAGVYLKTATPETLKALRMAVESPRQELFRRLNLAPGGIGVLLEMRRQVLTSLDQQPGRGVIDDDLAHLFKSWFNGGFLVLQRIDWRTSAVVLERLIQYEAVHQIQGWDDLRRRLEADRRCYAFFHPALPDEPLIFIEVALTQGISGRVQPLLDPRSAVVDPALANCAVFYSITNCQEGLRGISFGNLLIKQVVEDLRVHFPRLRAFVTLSPIPGFRKWLMEGAAPAEPPSLSSALVAALANPDLELSRPVVAAPLREEIVRLCAYYLLHAKSGKAPFDAVERFHLANGAHLERLNWLGDESVNGMRRSLGLMANYRYRLADIERNHQSYATRYEVVASRELQKLARQVRPPKTPFRLLKDHL